MEIKRIVVGVDMSNESIAALERAMAVARRSGAEIVLLQAGEVYGGADFEGAPASSSMEHYRTVLRDRLASDREALGELRTRFEGQGVKLSQTFVHGFADEVISNTAKELGADLVAVGTHGRTGLKRLFLGSVAERVLRLCETDVLVARGESVRPRQILVPTDFSPHADRALEAALFLAEAGATITLLHCVEDDGAPEIAAPLAAAIDVATRARVERVTPRDGDRELTVRVETRRGDTVDQIVAAAKECDLVCIGSHGRRGLRRLLLGSVAEAVVRHAPCSVYVAHIPKDSEP